MRTATITEVKNGLSAVIDRVREGETVLVTDRGVPVARIEPVRAADEPAGRRAKLHRAGLVRPASRALDVRTLWAPRPRLPTGVSAVAAVEEERRESR